MSGFGKVSKFSTTGMFLGQSSLIFLIIQWHDKLCFFFLLINSSNIECKKVWCDIYGIKNTKYLLFCGNKPSGCTVAPIVTSQNITTYLWATNMATTNSKSQLSPALPCSHLIVFTCVSLCTFGLALFINRFVSSHTFCSIHSVLRFLWRYLLTWFLSLMCSILSTLTLPRYRGPCTSYLTLTRLFFWCFWIVHYYCFSTVPNLFLSVF